MQSVEISIGQLVQTTYVVLWAIVLHVYTVKDTKGLNRMVITFFR